VVRGLVGRDTREPCADQARDGKRGLDVPSSTKSWSSSTNSPSASLLTFTFARRAQHAGGGKALLRLRIALVVIIVALAAVLLFLALLGWMIAERAARAAPAQRGSPRVPHTLTTGTTDHNVTTTEVDEQLAAAGAPRSSAQFGCRWTGCCPRSIEAIMYSLLRTREESWRSHC